MQLCSQCERAPRPALVVAAGGKTELRACISMVAEKPLLFLGNHALMSALTVPGTQPEGLPSLLSVASARLIAGSRAHCTGSAQAGSHSRQPVERGCGDCSHGVLGKWEPTSQV